jgi:CHAD domain-containing protein
MLLARRARALRRHLREAVDGDGHGVHQARVASRRLREAVPVLATGLKNSKAGKARKKIKRVTRALGSIRELDVTMALLDELTARGTMPRPALEDVRAYVTKEQERRRDVMLERLARVDVEKLDRRLDTLGETLQQARSEEWRATLSARLVKRSKLLRTAVDEAGHMYEAERLHKVRLAAKKLRYAAEMAAETGIRTAARPVRIIKRAQDTLGRLHDLQVLQSHVAAVQAMPRATVGRAGLDTMSRMLEEECRHLHAKYVSSIPDLQAVVHDIGTIVVPQLARPRGARRVAKMNLRAAPSHTARRVTAASH